MKMSQRVSALLSGHEIMTYGQTDTRTDGRTDKVISIGPPPTPSDPSRVIDGWMDGWMDDMRFYVLFNSISVISGRWKVDNERLCAMKLRVIERTRYHDKNLQRGIIPLKYRWRYGTVVTEHCLIMQYICTKFRENISKRLCAI